jgi:alanine racemase
VDRYRNTFAEINLDHLAHNFEAIRQALPEAPFLCPMVKANAYGHGDIPAARCLEQLGAKHLGVCLIEEGLNLREAGIQTDILIFRGFDERGAQKILDARLTPVVSTWEQFEILEDLGRGSGKAVQIHLKFNTGMNRLGFQPDEARRLFDRCWQNKTVRVQGILTHLYNGEDSLDPESSTGHQLRGLEGIGEIFKPLNPIMHALNSSGIINAVGLRTRASQQELANHPLTKVRWGLRPGLMLYGFNSTPIKDAVPLKTVMTFRSEAGNFREIEAGEIVSYGGTWKAHKKSRIAVVPVGYADGYHRCLSNKSSVLYRGQRVPVVGNICMDFFMIDISAVPTSSAPAHASASVSGISADDEVTLFGESREGQVLSAEELAGLANTISYEILTSVSYRVPRVYVGKWAAKLGVSR